jgi:hypothetical protein
MVEPSSPVRKYGEFQNRITFLDISLLHEFFPEFKGNIFLQYVEFKQEVELKTLQRRKYVN